MFSHSSRTIESASSSAGTLTGQVNLWSTDLNKWLKKWIWLYFLLLIFEGALRKWFLPSLATPLLIVRDPVAVWLLYQTWKHNLLPVTPYLSGMVAIGILSIFTAILLGHGNLAVALYGARILLIHFPLVFVIGRIFTREDVIKMGKIILWLTIPMTILIALQFYSPQSAWVNRGVGGDTAGAGFSGAMGFFRPPGTFSFTSGNTQFYSLVACFVFFFWLNPQNVSRLLLVGVSAALLAAIPFSISRGLLFQVIISLVFSFIAISRKPKYLGRMVPAIFGIGLVLIILSQFNFIQKPIEAFTNRIENSSKSEGGLEGTLGDRFLGGMLSALTTSTDRPFFGYGLGMGTNVGSMLLTGGAKFLISEEEWGRLIGEMGALLGILVIFIRLSFVVNALLASYKKLTQQDDMLPWMLLSFGILLVPQGQWAQPTALGFSTLIGGLILASLREPYQSN